MVLAAAGLQGCGHGQGVRAERPPPLRRVTVLSIRPSPVNLYDRGVEVVGVVPFSGPSGKALARKLADQLARTGMYRVVGPDEMSERLMRVGLTVRWDEPPTALRWVHERTGVDAVVGGRVVEFEVEGFERAKETLSLEPTGKFGFEWTEEGKLAYRERFAYRRVPLFCRTDSGTVGAAYRVWDLRRGEVVATVRKRLTAEIPSFCYRGDVPDSLLLQAQQRLLRRLFLQLNARFLETVVPERERRELAFPVGGGGGPSGLAHRNELGILYAARGRWPDAIHTWEECLAAAPDAAWVHYNLALALRSVGRVTEAAEHLKEALILRPRELYRRALREVRELGPRSPE